MVGAEGIQASSLRLITFRLVCGFALWLVITSSGCRKPFNVKTQPSFPASAYAASVTTDGVNIEAQAITDEDFLYDTFDANLILAGVLAVRVMLTNSGSETMDVGKARFEIRGPSGRSFKAVKERDAFKRLISYYEISAYSKSGYKESLDDFTANALDRSPLSGGQSRKGL